MKRRVLLVDDEPNILKGLGSILAGLSLTVHLADSAAAAVSALNRTEFDLVITDLMMETKTAGWQVVRAARERSHPPEVFILTAAYVHAAEWKRQGVKQLFMKGQAGPETLMKAVQEVLENRIGRQSPLSNQAKNTRITC